MVENAITYLANARARQVSLDHCVLTLARSEHMARHANQSANAKTMVYAIHKPAYANVQVVCYKIILNLLAVVIFGRSN